MKENRLSKMLAVGAISAVALTTAVAQETTTVTRSTDPVTGTTTTESATTTSVGTIAAAPASDYISFRTSTTAEPVKYYYTKSTTVVDPTGRTVEWSAVRPDMPATVYYAREGDRMIVRKVVLTRPVSEVIEKKKLRPRQQQGLNQRQTKLELRARWFASGRLCLRRCALDSGSAGC